MKTVALVLRGHAWRDDVVFADADLETAKRALEVDPACAAGTVAYKVLPWYR